MISFFTKLSKIEKGVIIIMLIIYLHNLLLDVMNVDAAQYAGISSEMVSTGSYLEVKDFGADYLDKPPLLFWLSAISIALFGATNFAYKLPSFLFLVFSLYAVYRFTLLYYSEKTAKNALLILASTQAYFLITNDVKTDGILTSCVIISVWLFSEYFEKRKLKSLILGSVFIGLAMLAKGPIGAIAVLMPLGINLMYQKKWHDVFNLRWLLVLIIVGLLLLPMSYGLYMQFDSHPEKGKSGLYFYYWLQSFGRITGESSWNNGSPWHFFLGSSIWDFFPWIFPFYIALFIKLKNVLYSKTKVPEITTLVGFIAVFSMMSLSKYKLPHYIFVTFPFASVILAQYLTDVDFKFWKRWSITYYFLGILILFLFIIFYLFFFSEFTFWVVFCIILQLFILFYFKKKKAKSVDELLILVLTLNLFLSFVFYPKLLCFQADAIAAKWTSTKLKNEEVFLFNKPSHLYNFYSQNPFTKVIDKNEIKNIKKPIWLYVSEGDLDQIKDLNVTITHKKVFVDYPISRLKLNFLLESKRANILKNKYLLKIQN